jgi:hypothetical protein
MKAPPRIGTVRRASLLAPLLLFVLTGCGGGALDNPSTVVNAAGSTGQKLSFLYFQRCVQPVLNLPLRVNINGSISTNTCAAAGCHDSSTGTGGALRLEAGAALVDTALAAELVRATAMYRNFYSSLGETVVGNAEQSRLINKPLVRGVLHGGGLIFESPDDPAAKVLRYWISRPMPQGQDEFSAAANSMFTPPDALTGSCNTQ